LKRVAAVIWIWAVWLATGAAAVAFSFVRIDVPIALYFWDASHLLRPLNEGLGAAVILSGESAVILFVVLLRLVRGHISVFGETLVIACVASMCVYVINDHVLKLFFGVPNPSDVMDGARHGFHLWMGSGSCSFPSGHMALAAAFAGVFMRLYKASIWPLCALLVLAAGLLVAGDWHFLSDIIAGALVGTSAGTLAGEGWAVHSGR
jgi:membrane-associated phospholipid phosphatase